MNESSGPPSKTVTTPPEFLGCEDAYFEGYSGLHQDSPYLDGVDLDLAWRAGQRDSRSKVSNVAQPT